jgi:ElaB/YqjD/DUF883 family membrane-anchored ribosome-binding protein
VENAIWAINAAFLEQNDCRRDAIVSRNTINICMNPNENDFTREEPLSAQLPPREEENGSTGRERFRRAKEKFSTEISQTWDQTKEKAGQALERTEHFMRENPVPTILGALGLGIAIGLAIRYITPTEPKREIEIESPWGKIDWSIFSLPFLWPLFKSARKKYEKSADTVGDAMKDGVKRLKKMDVERYAKPIRKRWRAWTR